MKVKLHMQRRKQQFEDLQKALAREVAKHHITVNAI